MPRRLLRASKLRTPSQCVRLSRRRASKGYLSGSLLMSQYCCGISGFRIISALGGEQFHTLADALRERLLVRLRELRPGVEERERDVLIQPLRQLRFGIVPRELADVASYPALLDR